MYVYTYICMYIHICWSKPGSLKTPQKQDENRGFDPGQAAGRTLGKLGGSMPVKLAKMRAKKNIKPNIFVASKGTTWHQYALFLSRWGCAWHYFNSWLLDARCVPGFHCHLFERVELAASGFPASSSAHWNGQEVGCVDFDFTTKLLEQLPPLWQAVLS